MAALPHCSACTWSHAPIQGNGPRPCQIMVLGEGPAKDEVRRGFPFAGRSGAEYDEQYLPLAGLSRPQVHTSNVSKCPFPGFRNPTPEEALVCSRAHLPAELRQVGPEIIITLGAVAASVFDTTYTPGSLGRPVDLETDYGLPTRASFGSWTGWLIPVHHPAAGMRQPRFMQALREGFSLLRDFIPEILSTGRPTLPVDPYPNPDYREIDSGEDLWHVLSTYSLYQDGPAIDTESDGPCPWSLQFSLRPGSGLLIDAGRSDLLRIFGDWLQSTRPLVILHHALHDLSVLLDMYPPVHPPRWIDTMMLAYHAQLFSQGLKPLAHRLLGMSMRDYNDVVTPHSITAVESYAVEVLLQVESDFQVRHTFKSGKRKGQSELRFPPDSDPDVRDTYNRYKALARDIQSPSRPPDFDPWKRALEWKPEVLAWGEALSGRPFPIKSIAHVPRPEAVHYAVRDADSCLRLLPVLRRLCARMGDPVLKVA